MAVVRWKSNALFPNYDTIWDDFFSRDFFSKGLDLGTSIPAVNTKETKSSYELDVAIPGMSKDDFSIDVDDDILTISSESGEEIDEVDADTDNITRQEFSYSSFQRSFQIPEKVDRNGIAANYENGLLRITLPKSKGAMTEGKRHIAIT